MQIDFSKTASLIKACEQCNSPYRVRSNPNKPSRFCSKQCKYEHGRVAVSCKRCQKPYTIQKNNLIRAAYCSPQCRHHNRIIQCAVCYKPIAVRPNKFARAIKERLTLHCSQSCLMSKPRPERITRVTKTCITCSKSYEVKNYRKDESIYCSRLCRNLKIKIECPICFKSFHIKRDQLLKNQTKGHISYCSRECSYIGLTRKPRTARHIEKSCETCGTSFTVRLYREKTARYCSRSCKSIAVVIMLGKKCPTSIEVLTYAALIDLGLVFEPQYNIGKFVVDAFVASLNLIVECQGDYFHTNPKIYQKGPINECQRRHSERDERKRAFFKVKGFQLIELWESDIKSVGATKLIKDAIASL